MQTVGEFTLEDANRAKKEALNELAEKRGHGIREIHYTGNGILKELDDIHRLLVDSIERGRGDSRTYDGFKVNTIERMKQENAAAEKFEKMQGGDAQASRARGRAMARLTFAVKLGIPEGEIIEGINNGISTGYGRGR